MRSSTSYREGNVPWTKGQHFGSRTKSVKQKISEGNIKFWENQTEEFLATDPICVGCKDPITNFSRLGLCEACRCYYNHLAYRMSNLEHCRKYDRDRKTREREERKRKDGLFPLREGEREEKEKIRAFNKGEREERRKRNAFCYRRTVSSKEELSHHQEERI